jgi:hypothetical protein
VPGPSYPPGRGAVAWDYPPGSMSWGLMRMAVGGRVKTAEIEAAVAALLASGQLIEVWTAGRGAQVPRHTLVIPGCAMCLRGPVVRVRGLRELVQPLAPDAAQWE